jgi:DNA-binding beta-propeller fold protein YncE
MDVASAKTLQTARVEGAPTTLLRSADGRRLLALDRGEGFDFGDEGFRAKTKSAVTIIDGRSLAVQARVELGTGLEAGVMLSAAGDMLSVVCPGYRSKKAGESRPRELVTVDLGAGKVRSRLELTRPSPEFLATPDGRMVVVLSPRETGKTPLPAELKFIDVAAGTVTATVPLEGDPRGPVLASGGQVLYLLDRGKPSNNPDKNQNGRVHVVSLASRAVTAVDAGSNPRGLVLDEDRRQLLLLSDGTPVKGPANRDRAGELRVIREGTVGAPIPVVRSPERVMASADGRSLTVVGPFGLTRLSLPGLTPVPPVAIGFGLGEITVSDDGRRAWVTFNEYFTTYDVEKAVRVAEVKTGRMGTKMLLGLSAGLKTESSRLTASNEARQEGRSYYTYTEYTVKQARNTLAVRPDGREIYALNSQTSDVTIIDAESGTIIEKLAAGGFAVHFMPSISAAVIPSASRIHVVDLASHAKQPDLVAETDAGFEGSELSPDARLAVVYGPKGIVFVNASSGKLVATMVKGQGIADVEIEWSR